MATVVGYSQTWTGISNVDGAGSDWGYTQWAGVGWTVSLGVAEGVWNRPYTSDYLRCYGIPTAVVSSIPANSTVTRVEINAIHDLGGLVGAARYDTAAKLMVVGGLVEDKPSSTPWSTVDGNRYYIYDIALGVIGKGVGADLSTLEWQLKVEIASAYAKISSLNPAWRITYEPYTPPATDETRITQVSLQALVPSDEFPFIPSAPVEKRLWHNKGVGNTFHNGGVGGSL